MECLSLASACKKELDFLRKRFTAAGVTERELREINVELTRQKLQFELLLLQYDVRKFGLNLKICYNDDMETVRSELSSGRLIPDRRLDQLLAMLSAIRYFYHVSMQFHHLLSLGQSLFCSHFRMTLVTV